MSAATIFLDTNVLLQCRPLQELDWSEVSADDEIRLVIASPVVDEIDVFKRDSNARRSKRARAATELFRRALDAEAETLVIRDNAPRVTLTFSTPLPGNRVSPPELDLARPDDRLIEEVLDYRTRDGTAIIVADDTALLLRAKKLSVPTKRVPDHWLLPPEVDESGKKIAALEATIAALRQVEASVSVAITDCDGTELAAIGTTLPFYADMSTSEVEELTKAVLRDSPQTTDFGTKRIPQFDANGSEIAAALVKWMQPALEWSPPSQDAIERYSAAYKKWTEAVKERFRGTAMSLNAGSRIIPLRIVLENTGNRPADGVLLEISCHGPIKIYASADGELPQLIEQVQKLPRAGVLPAPPEPPKGRRMFDAFAGAQNLFGHRAAHDLSLYGMPSIHPSRLPRDRHVFYARDEEDPDDRTASFLCDEVRHQRGPHVVRLWVVALLTSEPIDAKVHCRVTARNMSDALELHLPVRADSRVLGAAEVARNWQLEVEPTDTD